MGIKDTGFGSSRGSLLTDQSVEDPSRFTVCGIDEDGDTEDQLLNLIYDVDLHYGAAGGRLPLARLDIYGFHLTEPVKVALDKFGLTSTEEIPGGFSASSASVA